ncbi:D-lactate dehydrogenase (cytochrome) [Apiospora sp. TS-2023a]
MLRSFGAATSSPARAAAAAARARCPNSLLTRSSLRRYATEKEGSNGPSFKGQMLESISSRIVRERKEREKFAAQRENRAGSRNWAITFMFVAGVAASYWMGTLNPQDPDPHSTSPLSQVRPLRHNLGKANLEAAWTDFADIVGKENVSTIDQDLQIHSTSNWSSYRAHDSERPFAVVYPSTTEEVSQIMKVCHSRKIPVVGYSGGTSLEGHFTPTRGGISVDFSRMNKVISLHKEDLDVVVQPAVGWELLNEQLAKDNLFFPRTRARAP